MHLKTRSIEQMRIKLRRCKMQGSLQKQPHIKILPALSINERLRSREEVIDEILKTVQDALP
jgi:hypothetical protein